MWRTWYRRLRNLEELERLQRLCAERTATIAKLVFATDDECNRFRQCLRDLDATFLAGSYSLSSAPLRGIVDAISSNHESGN